MKLSESQFDKAVKRAIARIPEEIGAHLENIVISVRKRPSQEILAEFDPADGPLLGLYQGRSLNDRSATYPPLYPDTIFIFQEALEEMCETMEELEEEIELTVVHEIAHFIGFGEEQLEELGY
ncbi:MAG: metallopeptidase family protein [Smithellaceae bacterium]|nr:metallopeptidase family protein [Smithellaceae bacterium]